MKPFEKQEYLLYKSYYCRSVKEVLMFFLVLSVIKVEKYFVYPGHLLSIFIADSMENCISLDLLLILLMNPNL